MLPRLAALGKRAPLVNVVLFSLDHSWLPRENPLRVVVLPPIAYEVWRKRNIYLSIIVHCLLNTTGSFGLLALIMAEH